MTDLNPAQKAAQDDARNHGQFGEQVKAAPGQDVIIRRHKQDILDNPKVVDALGGTQLDDYEKAGLRMLLDSANDPWENDHDLDELLENFEHFTAPDMDDCHNMGRWLEEGYEKSEGNGSFALELLRDSDGAVTSYNVSRWVPGSNGFAMTVGGDVSELGNPEHGLASAAKTAGAMVFHHDNLKAEMRRIMPGATECKHTEKMRCRNGRTVCLQCGGLVD